MIPVFTPLQLLLPISSLEKNTGSLQWLEVVDNALKFTKTIQIGQRIKEINFKFISSFNSVFTPSQSLR